ncbi:hypothetical protein [Tolypothrix sp. VBCCA 56010]|uniref:hypothetical protein n=1 Tax=Tolypothrix sp. VBCCA 56010 TaxID=3137731 RepID=UPI003D7E90C3
MAYSVVNLASANAIFAAINVQIIKHELGYYFAKVDGEELKEVRLIDLSHAILRKLSCSD